MATIFVPGDGVAQSGREVVQNDFRPMRRNFAPISLKKSSRFYGAPLDFGCTLIIGR
jgi:hypothetical protein